MRTLQLLSHASVCEQLGQRIRQLRLLRNMSQRELAEMTQSSLSSIRRLESSGQGSIELLVRSAQSLQALDQFDSLLTLPVQSIADAERQQAARLRQRARAPRRTNPA
jgi:transcriptional regulator with XRE-family HTH domain